MNNETIFKEIESIKKNNIFKARVIAKTLQVFIDNNHEILEGERFFETATVPNINEHYQVCDYLGLLLDYEAQEYIHFYNNLEIVIKILDGLNEPLRSSVIKQLEPFHRDLIETYARDQKGYFSTTNKNMINCFVHIDFNKLGDLLNGFITTKKQLLGMNMLKIF